ncbi:hypothetical protein GTP23_09945 [Pseudoduganella sp. FT93W]|uniref:Uncharacterized protein n=1 Tax=Duganella fentianensis TaxID=2692177 RepID=A0A845HW83_9BURK|nr:hypothetical protein [Duganella fentianensis]MYN45370.1 hypothetical protein [Duganella fentianensis]
MSSLRKLQPYSIFKWLWPLVFISNVVGCSGEKTDRWKEQVLLVDGSVVVVQRTAQYVKGGPELAFNLSGGHIAGTSIVIPKQDGKSNFPEWSATIFSDYGFPEVPIVVDFKNASPEIYTAMLEPSRCMRYRRYVLAESSWKEKEIDFSSVSLKTNLLIDVDDSPKVVDVGLKARLNSDSRIQDYYRSVDAASRCIDK